MIEIPQTERPRRGRKRSTPIPDLLRLEWCDASRSIDTARVFDKAEWACSACGYRWTCMLVSRLYEGTGCPSCALVKLRRDLPAEAFARWDEKFPLGKHLSYTKGRFNWRCPRGHRRRATIKGFLADPDACGFCGQSRASRARSPRPVPEHVRLEWAEAKLALDDAPSKKKFRFKHIVSDPRYPGQVPCRKSWWTSIDKRLHGFGCPRCARNNIPCRRSRVLEVVPVELAETPGWVRPPGHPYKAKPGLIAAAIELRQRGDLSPRAVARSLGITLPTYEKYESMGLFGEKPSKDGGGEL